MTGWTDEQLAYRAALRHFVETNIKPRRQVLEHDSTAPYEVLRAYYGAFDVAQSALERFEQSLTPAVNSAPAVRSSAAETLIPLIEISRVSPGLVTALGVSVNVTPGAIRRAGTVEQKRRWIPDLLSLRKIGAWAITEPDSGSDAFGGMRSTAKPHGEGFVLNGSKTFITNGPLADTIVFICKLDDGTNRDWREREILTFVLDRGMDGLAQTPALRKMGQHSSPTGDVFAQDVYVERDRLLAAPSGESKSGVRSTFASERASIAATSLGIIEQCLEASIEYAKNRHQFSRPIGDFQLIQLKLAEMEIARLNVENMVLRYIEKIDRGDRPTVAEASAMKLYSARTAFAVATEAVQLHGGNGYMAENIVEQLARDAKVLQIYGGTDEIQVTHIARELMKRSI